MEQIVLVVIVVGLAAFMYWNSRKRKRQTEATATQMVPGARVMLSFGVYGTLLSVNDEKVTAEVEVAPGVILTVHRQTLSRVVVDDEATPVEPTTEPESHGVVLNGVSLDKDTTGTPAPEYGVRTTDPADVEAAKRKSDD